MEQLLLSGRLIDLILLLIAAEAVGIFLLHRLDRRRPGPRDLYPNLASGAALMYAVKLALQGAAWYALAACLALAFLAHLTDLSLRYGASPKIQLGQPRTTGHRLNIAAARMRPAWPYQAGEVQTCSGRLLGRVGNRYRRAKTMPDWAITPRRLTLLSRPPRA